MVALAAVSNANTSDVHYPPSSYGPPKYEYDKKSFEKVASNEDQPVLTDISSARPDLNPVNENPAIDDGGLLAGPLGTDVSEEGSFLVDPDLGPVATDSSRDFGLGLRQNDSTRFVTVAEDGVPVATDPSRGFLRRNGGSRFVTVAEDDVPVATDPSRGFLVTLRRNGAGRFVTVAEDDVPTGTDNSRFFSLGRRRSVNSGFDTVADDNVPEGTLALGDGDLSGLDSDVGLLDPGLDSLDGLDGGSIVGGSIVGGSIVGAANSGADTHDGSELVIEG